MKKNVLWAAVLFTALLVAALSARFLHRMYMTKQREQVRAHEAQIQEAKDAAQHRAYMQAGLAVAPMRQAFRPISLQANKPSHSHGAISIGVVGDSISVPVAAVAAQAIADSGEWQTVSLTNGAVSSSATADWLPAGAFPLLARADRAFTARHVSVVLLMLGTNDAWHNVSPREYRLNLKVILANLTEHGWRVIINCSPALSSNHGRPLTETARENGLLVEYQAQITSLCDGKQVLLGDTAAYKVFWQHQERLRDGTHPDTKGQEMLGQLWAQAALRDIRM